MRGQQQASHEGRHSSSRAARDPYGQTAIVYLHGPHGGNALNFAAAVTALGDLAGLAHVGVRQLTTGGLDPARRKG